MRPERAGGTSDAGSFAPSSHASASKCSYTPLSLPTGAPGPITKRRNADTPPADLIDTHSPSVIPGENTSGLMATMNLHCN